MAAGRFAMASVLLWAGLEKARSPISVASAMHQLGVPRNVVRSAAALLIAIELAVALGLIFEPGSPATLAGLVVLSTGFAVAGIIAVARDEAIHCSCFGPTGDAYLGKRQLVALPFWLAGAALLGLAEPAHSTVWDAASSFALVCLIVSTLRSVIALKASKVACDDRRSAQEMLVWLRR